MSFIEAWADHLKENKFRYLLPKKVFETTVSVWKKVNAIYKKTKKSSWKKCTKKFEPFMPW
jgi:hypothetical protein